MIELHTRPESLSVEAADLAGRLTRGLPAPNAPGRTNVLLAAARVAEVAARAQDDLARLRADLPRGWAGAC